MSLDCNRESGDSQYQTRSASFLPSVAAIADTCHGELHVTFRALDCRPLKRASPGWPVGEY